MGVGGFLLAGGHSPPFFEPGPQPFDLVAMNVDPVRTGDWRLVALGWDRRLSA